MDNEKIIAGILRTTQKLKVLYNIWFEPKLRTIIQAGTNMKRTFKEFSASLFGRLTSTVTLKKCGDSFG